MCGSHCLEPYREASFAQSAAGPLQTETQSALVEKYQSTVL